MKKIRLELGSSKNNMDTILIAKAKRIAQGKHYEQWCGNGNEEVPVDLGASANSLEIGRRLSEVVKTEVERIGGTIQVGEGYIDCGKGYARVVDRFTIAGEDGVWMISGFYFGDKSL